ncbi:hypothetical protein BD289DRAFT_254186 [Coniella lustricola]|uniref:Uncharacterized protein n=1 Tax=Coniella lustricola TaxID=2025994 RepID=A0A2T3A882_9PEZI|nr:hypothetical protein BD289DRAFT_254186 [Coniella lustricola]
MPKLTGPTLILTYCLIDSKIDQAIANMDWAEDRLGISEGDFHRVWRYDERYSTVVQLTSVDKSPLIWSLGTKAEWEAWFKSGQYPEVNGCQSGLVLITSLAKRSGEKDFKLEKRSSSNEWLSEYNEKRHVNSDGRKASLTKHELESNINIARRSVRSLPFTESTFRLINQKFYLHHSISSVVSKADMPVFYSAEIEVDAENAEKCQAQVYHSRTTNAWDMDLALTVTHFPAIGLSYAIIFGCPLAVEEVIIRRISRMGPADASHPLMIPGIFAEIERTRHIQTIELMAEKVEGRMFELDYPLSEQYHHNLDLERAQRQPNHKDDYHDMAYLKNSLVSWRTQLSNMLKQAQQLENAHVRAEQEAAMAMQHTTALSTIMSQAIPASDVYDHSQTNQPKIGTLSTHTEAQHGNTMSIGKIRRIGHKIIGRLQAIMDEYDDKIRDCTMRLDGMSIATQWAQGETSVEIGLATSNDSKHMRSIAIVTMVFLPGTFLASVFSMSFFSWFSESGTSQVQVSSYIWIYIAVALVFTVITIGLWYYFNIWRRPERPEVEELQLSTA